MDSNEVLKLIDAGFTADEIRAMKTDTNGGNPDEKPEGNPEENPEEKPEGNPEGKNADIEALTATIKELQSTVKALQTANINNGKTDKPAVSDKIKETIDSFIKDL